MGLSSDLKFWKKCVLFLSAIPLAVIGNGVRIASIGYGGIQTRFAAKTWHDWSGLPLFYPSAAGPASIPCWPGNIWNPFRRKVVVKMNKAQ
ncbi:MAG: exosortase/archaeosortase family protein [Akkermansia muciniphila]